MNYPLVPKNYLVPVTDVTTFIITKEFTFFIRNNINIIAFNNQDGRFMKKFIFSDDMVDWVRNLKADTIKISTILANDMQFKPLENYIMVAISGETQENGNQMNIWLGVLNDWEFTWSKLTDNSFDAKVISKDINANGRLFVAVNNTKTINIVDYSAYV